MSVISDIKRVNNGTKDCRRPFTTDDPLQDLCNAIVAQAAEDYRDSLKELKRDPDDRFALIRAGEIERFFKSEWCRKLTKVDPFYIRDRIRAEVGVSREEVGYGSVR